MFYFYSKLRLRKDTFSSYSFNMKKKMLLSHDPTLKNSLTAVFVLSADFLRIKCLFERERPENKPMTEYMRTSARA